MRLEDLVYAFKEVYFGWNHKNFPEIVTDDFSFCSDFDDFGTLDAGRFQKYLTDLQAHVTSYLDFTETRFNRKRIEYVVEQEREARRCLPGFVPFAEPRLLQCELANGKIRKIRQCHLSERKIPEGINQKLLEACQRNDFSAAKAAITEGAYAGNWELDKSCLAAAARSGSAELCRLLLADESEPENLAEALFAAVKNPDTKVLTYLIDQGAPLDAVSDEDYTHGRYYTPLDYAVYFHCKAAEEILRAAHAPTLKDLREWCFLRSEVIIRIAEKCSGGDDMSIGTAGEKVDYRRGNHISATRQWFYMNEDDFCYLVEQFLSPYMTKEFEPYLDDNLIPLPQAQKAISDIEDFCRLLQCDFDDSKIVKMFSRFSPSSHIQWGIRQSKVVWSFSEADRLNFWRMHRGDLVLFYQDFALRLKKLVSAARRCGDRYLNIVGP